MSSTFTRFHSQGQNGQYLLQKKPVTSSTPMTSRVEHNIFRYPMQGLTACKVLKKRVANKFFVREVFLFSLKFQN